MSSNTAAVLELTGGSRGPRHRARLRDRRWQPSRLVAFVLAITTALIGITIGTSPASAAAGSPWSTTTPQVFISTNTAGGTTLYQAVTDGTGTTTFSAQGVASNFVYNSIGFWTVDGYIYGVASTTGTTSSGQTVNAGDLIRIGQGAYTTLVKTGLTPGTTGTGTVCGNTYYVIGGAGASTTLYSYNLSTGVVSTTTMSSAAPSNSADFTCIGGFLWGADNANHIYRLNPTTGALTVYTVSFLETGNLGFGAAWTYGNGNLGIDNNSTGDIYQIKITNPGGATPTFTLVAMSNGPSAGGIDGTSVPGNPTDLSISKTGPAAFLPGNTISYTLTVTNNGTGTSSGFVVSDTVPSPLTNVAASSSGCSISGNAVTCVSGTLAVGASQSFTITASTPAGMTACVTNTASVTANETDPTSGNNTSSATSCPAAVSLVKTASVPSYSAAGQSVTYTFTGKNTGAVALHNVQIAEGTFTGSGTLSGLTCNPALGGTLAAGASMVCTATYTTTQTDVNAGSLANTATITGLDPLNETVTANSGVTVPATQSPAIALLKTATPTTVTAAGQAVAYSFQVTNTGNVTLTSVGLTESAFSGTGSLSAISCPTTTLAPGASTTCTATYTVTQADVDAGKVDNTATAHGTPPAGAAVVSTPSTATVTATAAPGVALAKSVSPSTVTAADQSVTYSFKVTNTGNVTLTGAGITETAFTGTGTLSAITCPTTTLAPGASTTCTATYTVTQADVDAGKVDNTATAHGTPPTGAAVVSTPSSAEVLAPAAPTLTLVKTASPNTPASYTVGQLVTYSFLVTNTGNVTLSNLSVNETVFTGSGTMSATTCPVTTLTPGASTTCTATYTLTQADIDATKVNNTATAQGTPPGSSTPVLSNPSSTQVPITGNQAISLLKSVSPSSVTAAGQTVTYSFQLTNTGNVTLTGAGVTETAFSGTGTMSAISCPTTTLAPGASTTCTATYAVTQADIDAGTVTNTALAHGTPPTGPDAVSTPSSATVTATSLPAIGLVKTGAITTGTGNAGDTITYTFTATNTGNVTLTGVAITDPLPGLSALTYGTWPSGTAGTLAPAESVTATATYTITQADVDAGAVTNLASATGTPPSGPPVTGTDGVTIPLTQAAGITLVKSATPTTVTAAGDTVTYSFVVTNTGNVTLTSVGVTETAFSGTGTVSAITCPATSLAPGASTTCTATYAVTQADVDAGSVTNTATATGTPPVGAAVVSAPSTAVVTATSAPAMSIVKSGTISSGTGNAGDTITYTFTATNSGNVTMTGVTISDPLPGLSALTYGTWSSGTAGTLAPGQSVTATATYTITQADVDAGGVTNVATTTGNPPSGPPVTSPPGGTTIPLPATPAITLTKTATPTVVTAAGQSVDYSFVVTNTGNVTLSSVGVTETAFTGTGTLSAISCPATTLAPGASTTCTATYTVTQADVDAGMVTNTATATGTPPVGAAVVSAPSTAVVTATQAPAVTVVKSASPNAPASYVVGQLVTYSFVVTNTGNVTLSNVSVTETAFTGSGTMSAITCPATTLAPGASTTCTATYTLTQADIDAGQVDNTATAQGTPPGSGTPTVSGPSSARVPALPDPAVSLLKSGRVTSGTGKAGDTITYSFTATNTGNVTLTGVSITDPLPGLSALTYGAWPAGAGTLEPGQSVTATATYTIAQADVDAGAVTNLATATGNPPSGPPVQGPGGSTVPLPHAPGVSVVKSVSAQGVVQAGQALTYTFVVTNTGDTTLTGVTVSDPLPGLSALTYGVWPSGTTGTLLPGEEVTATATYTVTATDAAAGKVVNTATATGNTPGGGTVHTPSNTVTVTVQPPALLTTVGGVLAHTGADIWPYLGAGALSLLAGAVLLGTAIIRRRKSA
ncbi:MULTISPECIES: DUF11 domain-containing protein [unclassified Leifsonia]|uniref:beta strand repeat-containing protein n=1 Tax=unclassified Leifsonia TaxID=2663824 RepID=UPI0008A7E16C|nr:MULTISPECIES: DUF11 domain-containing protein [unclassified Leifsonia]SEH56839.1 conserved repeat domain-containing protein [Leifsonia sp. CL154]SFL22005.1 conserved repeat domain-containing protein [Leifsonia sp. CL147]